MPKVIDLTWNRPSVTSSPLRVEVFTEGNACGAPTLATHSKMDHVVLVIVTTQEWTFVEKVRTLNRRENQRCLTIVSVVLIVFTNSDVTRYG